MRFFIPLIFILTNVCFGQPLERTYSPYAKAYLSCQMTERPIDSVDVSVTAYTILPKGVSSNSIVLTRSGSHYLEIEIDRPLVASVMINNDNHNVVLWPNDTTSLQLDIDLKPQYIGEKRLINDYYLRKKKHFGYTNIYGVFNALLSPELTYDLLKSKIDSVVRTELDFFQTYSELNSLHLWLNDYEHAEVVYSGASYKSMFPMYNEVVNVFSDSLPSNYYQFLNGLQIDNPSAIHSSSYLTFLKDYFTIDTPIEYQKLSGFERVSRFKTHRLSKSKLELRGEVKKVYHTSEFMGMLKYYSDDADIDSVAKEYQLSDHPTIVKAYQAKLSGARRLSAGDVIPEFFLIDDKEETVSIRDFKSQLIYLNIWATWCKPCIKNIPALNEMVESFSANSEVEVVNICLDSNIESWRKAKTKYDLKGISLFADRKQSKNLRSIFSISGIPHYVITSQGRLMIENFANNAPGVRERLIEILNSN